MAHQFVFLEPGHFHAALVLRVSSERVDNTVHVYSSVPEEYAAFAALVDAFNSRADAPTAWRIERHSPPSDPAALADAHPGATLVLAGRNNTKLSVIAALAKSGVNVLADKPWLTEPSQVSLLDAALDAPGVVMDIMTIRHEILSRLCHEVVHTPAVFGVFDSSRGPAIELGSVHHLFKLVNGQPLRRPVWYFDAAIQGDGLVDIQSHMVEQAMWFAIDEDGPAPECLTLVRATRWSTPVDAALFLDATGSSTWPASLEERLADGVLEYPCNGEIDWLLGDVSVRQRAEWRAREPEGGGDLHAVRLRGTLADVVVDQGPETDFRAWVRVVPHDGDVGPANAALARWRERFEELTLVEEDGSVRFVAPEHLDDGHESHFALVRDHFLDCVDGEGLPDSIARRIHARYGLLASACEGHEEGEPSQ